MYQSPFTFNCKPIYQVPACRQPIVNQRLMRREMTKEPKLQLVLSQADSAPVATPELPRRPNGREHTNYVDLVSKLRNPLVAEPIIKWMKSGRAMGRPVGALKPRQQLSKPKETVRAYGNFVEDFFGEDKSGSFFFETCQRE